MQRRHSVRAYAALFVLLPAFARAAEPPSSAPGARAAGGKTVRVLTIGNSFSQNATKYLSDLAETGGDTLVLRGANVGGASMELHWSKVEAFEKNPQDKAGQYSGKGLRELLAVEPWDYVTIQQASIKSHGLANYRPFAGRLAEYVRKHAPGAELVIHQTWEYRADDPRFTKPSSKPGEPKTHDEMYAGLSQAYAAIAAELSAFRLPVGDAFHLAGRDATWGFRPSTKPFDPQQARPGELPEQIHSLHVGWTWRKPKDGGKPSLIMDGHHANTAGEYLGACVWYECLFGKDVRENSFVPKGIDAEYARFLRTTAHEAVALERQRDDRVRNLPAPSRRTEPAASGAAR